jgi:glycosyltransferase involved in cell wall biosynthesis
MQVLNLVTTPRPFFDEQVEVLNERGVETETVAVPGRGSTNGSRSVLDYARFYPMVFRESLNDYDVVHANYGWTAPFAIAQPRRPIVLSLWGSDLMGRPRPVVRRCAPLFDRVIVMSDRMADDIDCDVTVIPHGVDFDKFRPIAKCEALEQVGWDPDAKHVLFPYHQEREVKDYPKARRIVNTVDDRLEADVRLQVVHDVPHEELYKYMNASDVLLMTSKWEGSPNSIKEALACNLPVVAREVGDVPELLEGVANSYADNTIPEMGERLEEVLRKGERSNGRANSRTLNQDTMANRLLQVYERVRS